MGKVATKRTAAWRAAISAIAALLAFAVNAPAQQASKSAWDIADFRLWTYVPYWTTGSQIDTFATDGMHKHVSDVFYFSGIRPNADGTLYEPQSAKDTLNKLKTQAAANGFRLQMSMFDVPPGETVTNVWHSMTKDHRATFVSNIVSLLNTYNMQGINLDWERPTTVEDWNNYTQLAKDLQAALGSKEVSICDYGGTDPLWDDAAAFDAHAYDQLFIMAYNYPAFHPQPTLWNNSNSFINSKLNISANDSSQAFTAHQLTLGVGTYADGVDPDGDGNQKAPGSITLKSIIAANPNLAYDVGSVTGTYGGVTGTWVFESRQQVREKTQLALDRGLGGMFTWDIHQDSNTIRSLDRVMHHYIVFKKGIPDLNLDGKVDAADANTLADNMGTVPGWTGTDTAARMDKYYLQGNWEKGDREGNGFVNQSDADWLAGRFTALGVTIPDRLAFSGTFENFANSRGVAGRWRAKREAAGNLRETGNFTQHGTTGLTWTGSGIGADKHSNYAVTIRNQNSAEAFDSLNTAQRSLSIDLATPIDLGANTETYVTFLVRSNTASLLASQTTSANRTLSLEFLDSAGVNQFDFTLHGQQQQFAIQSQADVSGQDVTGSGFSPNTTYLFIGKIAGNGADANTMQARLYANGASLGNFAYPGTTWSLTAQSSAAFNPTITQLQFTSLYEGSFTVSNVWVGTAADFFARPSSAMGDFNNDGIVDMADSILWRKTFGYSGNQMAADANGNGAVDEDDYMIWRAHYGQIVSGDSGGSLSEELAVPEPASAALLAIATATLLGKRRRAHRS